jgi:hypothetical protein
MVEEASKLRSITATAVLQPLCLAAGLRMCTFPGIMQRCLPVNPAKMHVRSMYKLRHNKKRPVRCRYASVLSCSRQSSCQAVVFSAVVETYSLMHLQP